MNHDLISNPMQQLIKSWPIYIRSESTQVLRKCHGQTVAVFCVHTFVLRKKTLKNPCFETKSNTLKHQTHKSIYSQLS